MNIENERSIFLEAIDIESEIDRKIYLQRACGDDANLLLRLERLIEVHFREEAVVDRFLLDSFRPENSDRTSLFTVPVSGVGFGEQGAVANARSSDLVDGYRLMEQIGEGGFGIVFVAQQDRPVRRKVALKIVKKGMGSKEILARFEAERQALAMMDHPNIARVFDAGVHSDGRPYFVMELVRGIPITEFCDKAKLSIEKRLLLFIDVCSAVHHAHQKGIIHRDLKPSNILTTLYDDRAMVKVIDFGIAKAISQSLTDKTIYTRFMALMGTPLYMSPEQAEMNGLDVDTRSDIYSLGVLLYEILTGATPFDRERMDKAGLQELRHMILEEEPPRPSLRLSTLNNQRSTISEVRNIAPEKLATTLRGDLDWIVMKAIEKDRTRRYDSAAALSRDIERFLASEPIEARPPSSWYRCKKYISRNRLAFLASVAIALSLLLGTAVSLHQMSKAIQALGARELALQEAIQAKQEATDAKLEIEQFSQRIVEANQLLSLAQGHVEEREWEMAENAFQKAINLQSSYYLPWVQRAQWYMREGDWLNAANDYAQAIRLGAPIDSPQWQGVLSLFEILDMEQVAILLSEREWKAVESENDQLSSQLLRDLVFQSQPISADRWSTLAMKWNTQRAVREDVQRRGPSRGIDRPWRPGDTNREPPRHEPFGSMPRFGEPGRKVGPGGPAGVNDYLMGLIRLRTQEWQLAKSEFTKAFSDRNWPGNELASLGIGLASFHLGEIESGRIALAKSQDLIEGWFDSLDGQNELLSPADGRRKNLVPWFDITEGVLLHDELATQLGESSKSRWRLRIEALSKSAREHRKQSSIAPSGANDKSSTSGE